MRSPSRVPATLVAVLSLWTLAVPAARAQAPAGEKKAAAAPKAAVSEVLKVKRPKGGEYLGVYLVDKKMGWLYTHLEPVPGKPGQARYINELVFKAQVDTALTERRHREERVYESRPGGRLLSFVVEQRGDGGEQTLVGTATPEGLQVVRKRPGRADEVLKLPPTEEKVEDADHARVALLRQQKVEGHVLDALDLRTYPITTTVEPAESRLVGGVMVKLRRTVTLSEKEKVPVVSWVAEDGRMLLQEVGQSMQARAEPEAVAKHLDKVDIFGLTRVVLPQPFPQRIREVPGQVRLVVEGLPEDFARDEGRQKYERQPNGRYSVVLTAAAPSPQNLKERPLADPEGGENLEATLSVESEDKEIRSLAEKLAGQEKDAWKVARAINDWVAKNLEKGYGISSDRATDVLRQRRGDCTEHSLLTVALLRAAKIPARRVDGLVYLMNSDGVPALYWHEWVEAYVGEWVQMDPTFQQTVADATHFALGLEGSAELTPLLGRLKVVAAQAL